MHYFYIITVFTALIHNPLLHKNRINNNIRVNMCKKQFNYRWEEIPNRLIPRVINKYFKYIDSHFANNIDYDNDTRCEVFTINGMPCTLILYKNVNKYLSPIVESILYDKNMLIIFNATDIMKDLLNDRHNNINIEYADNNIFMKYYH